MGLDIFFIENIRNAILAANESRNPSLAQIRAFLSCIEQGYRVGAVTAVTEAYKQGHRDALMTVALSFGLSLVAIHNEQQRRLLDGQNAETEGDPLPKLRQ